MADLTHYERLGVDERATDAQIRSAYRTLARKLHPDMHAHRAGSPSAGTKASTLSGESFALVAAAYEVLSDEPKRREYDAQLAIARAKAARAAEGRVGSDYSGGQPHYTWTNIADSGPHVGGREQSDFDELWMTFFAPRVREQKAKREQ